MKENDSILQLVDNAMYLDVIMVRIAIIHLFTITMFSLISSYIITCLRQCCITT